MTSTSSLTGGPIPVSATISVILENRQPPFTESCYCAPAGQAFTLKLTNSMFTLRDKKPVPATLAISPSHDPAIAPVPGRPGWATGSTALASFVAPTVLAPDTGVFTVPALAAGSYVMQTMEGGLGSTVTLIVQ